MNNRYKALTIIIVSIVLVFAISTGINSVYFSHEITDAMVEEWAAEVEEYRGDSSLQILDTNHGVMDSSGTGVLFRVITFDTIARQIMEEAHQAHRQYREPDIDELKNIIEREEYLRISQLMVVEDRGDRDPDAMHLVFKIITPEDEEKIIQPNNVIESDARLSDRNHWSVKVYNFDYDDFPSHQEYIDNDYEISGIHISRVGEIELDIPWDEIR